MPLDPQAEALLAQMREAGVKPFEELTVAEARVAAWGYRRARGRAAGGRRRPHDVHPRPDRGHPDPHLHARRATARAAASSSSTAAAGSSRTSTSATRRCGRWRTRRAASSSSVNYQKAPEHPFPVPFDDCWAATDVGVRERRGRSGSTRRGSRSRGDSAGGNLAAAVCLKARDEGGPRDRLPGARLPGARPQLGHRRRASRTPRATACSARRCAGSGTTTSRTRPTPTTRSSRPLRAADLARPAARVHRHRRVRPAARRRRDVRASACRGRRAGDRQALRRDDPRLLLDARGARRGAGQLHDGSRGGRRAGADARRRRVAPSGRAGRDTRAYWERCPSCPRSRRSAASSRPSSRGAS